jgi:hypothetical protein
LSLELAERHPELAALREEHTLDEVIELVRDGLGPPDPEALNGRRWNVTPEHRAGKAAQRR